MIKNDTASNNIYKKSKSKTITFTALSASVICVLGPLSIPLPFSPVPISLTLFAVYLAAYILGAKLSAAATGIYILLGLAGLPVFSSFSSGAAKLLGPTGGYIIGYLMSALIAGAVIDKFENKRCAQILGMSAGTFVCYVFGTIWLSYQSGLSFKAALWAGVIPFIPADIVKIASAALIGMKIRKAVRRI